MSRNNKGILIVGGGLLQIVALEVAKELGYYTYLTDMNENCPSRDYTDEFIKLSTKDIEGHVDLSKKLRSLNKISAVYTQGADVEYTVAMAAKAANLPGIDPEAALNCNDKIRMRKLLNDNGIDNVKYAKATTIDEACQAIEVVGLPCIIKPLDNSASRGVTKIYNKDKIPNAFSIALSNCFHKKEVIIEELLLGDEYSVDTIIYKDVLYPAGISDRVFKDYKDFAIQIGSRTPSLLPTEIQSEMYSLLSRAAKVLGVTEGAFKGDLIVVNGKPKIIEVTARTSGGFDSQYRKPYSFGINIIKATIDIALGKKLNPVDLIPKWFKWSMTTSVFPSPGTVKEISGIEELRNIAGVRNIFMDLQIGDSIESYTNCASRVNHIIITADTFTKLMEIQEEVQKTLLITTTEETIGDVE